MSKINYVIRPDGSPNLFSGESDFNFLDTDELLENYPYIIDSMEKDDYYLENGLCSLFDEIVFENKVVGFATYEVRGEDSLLMSECFIIPEFRGNRLFFDEICKMLFLSDDFGILQPTRKVVELLLDYAFAKNVNEDIVVSAIEFYFDDYDVKSTKNRKLDEDEMKPSNFYDLSINSTVLVDDDEVIYHQPLENDLIKHGSRKELTEDYFSNLKEFFAKNNFDELIVELKEELPQVEFGFNEIIGHGGGLSDFMQNMVDDNFISSKQAFELKNQLTEEYESGKLDDEDVLDRFTSLVYHDGLPFDDFRNFRESINSNEDVDEDFDVIKDFVNVIGDNEKLGNEIMESLISGNDEDFENLIMGAMANDEKFLDNFLNLANKCGGENNDEFIIGSDFYDDVIESKYKLDDTVYGKDYPISYDLDIFIVLNSLNEGVDYNIIMDLTDFEVSMTKEMFTHLLLDSDFIQKEEYDIDWVNSASEFSKVELKDILRENNLKTSGNKPELLKRLAENNITLSETYIITPKGKDYLIEFSWINYYLAFLCDFDFDDFYRYLETHEGNLKKISLGFLDEHIALARENDDKEYLGFCIYTKKVIMDESDGFFEIYDISE